jgi:hypothetical protein
MQLVSVSFTTIPRDAVVLMNLGARSLFGVEDTKVYPVRGQTILVYSPSVNECMTVVPAGEKTFYLPKWPELTMCDIRYYGRIWGGNIRYTTGLDPRNGATWGHF